jgi:rhodanese-related sulfurtransferase
VPALAQKGEEGLSTGPIIQTLDAQWYLGDIEKGATKEKSFQIKNAGGKELIIKEIHTCCGYGVSDVSSWAIKPNDTATIKVICKSKQKPLGQDEKTVIISSNDINKPELEIKVFANIVERPKAASAAVPVILAEELYTHKTKGDTIVALDVREKSEFSEKHIPGAINCPKSKFKFANEDELANLVRVDKKPMIAVYCGGGLRSSYITSKLREHGYNAFSLDGGLAVWEKQGYAMAKGPKMEASLEPLVINSEEAYGHYFLLFNDKIAWVDVRDRQVYQRGHIKNAINIPTDELEQKMSLLSPDKETVFYCSGPGCEEAKNAAILLMKNGFKQAKIKVFEEGYSAWEGLGYPQDKKEAL